MLKRFVFAALVLCTVASCHHTKNLTSDAKKHIVDLDSIEVNVPRNNPYRASATKYFDLIHTKLEVSFNYQKQRLNGSANIILKPHFYTQNTLTLDAKNFDIMDISVLRPDNTSQPLTFTYDSLQLNIQLDKPYTRNDTLNLKIVYTAKPNERKTGGSAAITDDKGLYFINPLGKDSTKPVQIWTQGETESNSAWFPTIDKPNQKMTDEIYITHLKKYVSLSNGVLVSSKDNGDSTVTDYWKMNLPHAPYLVMMAIGDFAIVKDHWRDIPVDYYVEHKYEPYAKKIFGNTPEMMEFFSQKLGFDYAWPKYDQVVVRDYVSGAMENTTATLHGEFLNRNNRQLLDETYEDVISHELFHQWFGDLVTTESWSNIPLNESFADYGEYLWNEYKYGKMLADMKRADNLDKYLDEAKEKNVDLIRFYYNDREDMFDRHSYEKGGLVLHYLRNVVGDDAFFKSLELYLKTNQFKPVEIHQLRLAFEEVTGRDMNWFFNEWFLAAGHPVLDIKYSYKNDSVFVEVTQKHNIDKPLVYTLPFRIDVYYGNKVEMHDVELNSKDQTFAFKANGTPDLIDADGKRVLLCEKKENKTAGNYIFQYNHTPLFAQRNEALEYLSGVQKNNDSARAVLVSALNDSFYYFRQLALEELTIPDNNADSIWAIVEKLAQHDNISHVRKAAINKLSKAPAPAKYEQLFEQAVGDSSYSVAGEALKALEKVNSKKAMNYAKGFQDETIPEIAAAVADVYSKDGDATYQDFFRAKLQGGEGFAKYYTFYYYANFLTRMDRGTVLSGIQDIENEAKDATSHYTMGAAKGAMNRIQKWFGDRKKEAQAELAKEDSKTAKVDLEEKINDYDQIVGAAADALERLNKKSAEKK